MSNIGHSIFPISIGCLGFLGILKMVGEGRWAFLMCAIVRNSDVWAHIIGHSTPKEGNFFVGITGSGLLLSEEGEREGELKHITQDGEKYVQIRLIRTGNPAMVHITRVKVKVHTEIQCTTRCPG